MKRVAALKRQRNHNFDLNPKRRKEIVLQARYIGAPAILATFGDGDLGRLRASGIAGSLITSWELVA